jgi:hypothetical protein
MVVFTISAKTIPVLKARAASLKEECRIMVAEETCGNNCYSCWISNCLPRYGEAQVDRYSAVTVGAYQGIARVSLSSGEVVLSGDNGEFIANPHPRGGIQLTKIS